MIGPVVDGVVVLIVNSLDPPDAAAVPSRRRKPEQGGRATPLKQTPGGCPVRATGVNASIAARTAVLLSGAFMRRQHADSVPNCTGRFAYRSGGPKESTFEKKGNVFASILSAILLTRSPACVSKVCAII